MSEEALKEIEARQLLEEIVTLSIVVGETDKDEYVLKRINRLAGDALKSLSKENAALRDQLAQGQTGVLALIKPVGVNAVGKPTDAFALLTASIAELQSRLAQVEKERNELSGQRCNGSRAN